jgi:replicative DNA helicase
MADCQLTTIKFLRFLLLLHILRSTSFIERVATVLKPEDFSRDDEKVFRLAWAISRDWYLEHRTAISQNFMLAEISRRTAEDPEYMHPHDVVKFMMVMPEIYTQPADTFNADYMIKYVQEFIDERRVRAELQAAADSLAPLGNSVKAVSDVYTSSRISTGTPTDIFSASAKSVRRAKKQPTGVVFIDMLLDGGIAPGEIYGLVGISGQGKSILAQQIAIELARQHVHVAVFHYEMDMMPTVQNRIYGYLAGIPKDMLGKYACMDDFPAQYRDALQTAEDAFAREYLHMYGMKETAHGGAHGMEDVFATLRDLERQGIHVQLVVIDQLIPMARRGMMATGQAPDQAKQRHFMQQYIDVANQNVGPTKFNTAMLIVHQAGNDTKGRPPTIKPKQGETFEDKGFDNWICYLIALGNQDEERRCWCVTTKARGIERDGFIIQLNEHFPRFDYVPNKYRAEKKCFVTNTTTVSAGPGSIVIS